MPVNLTDLMSNSARVEIPTSAGDINVDYYPNKLTQKVLTQFVKFGDMAQNIQSEEIFETAFLETNTLLVSLVKAWDLMDEQKCEKCERCKNNEECEQKKLVPFPLKPDRLGNLPAWLINTITQAIMEHSHPNQLASHRAMTNSRH